MTAPMAQQAGDVIQRLLRRMRVHLNLDVAFVSELTAESRVFRYVDAAGHDAPIRVGGHDPRRESYCHYVASGELPQLVRDCTEHPVTAALAVTHELAIGSYASVPIVLADGTVYGTFCGFAFHVEETLDDADVAGLRLMAEVVADLIDERHSHRRHHEQRRQRLRDAAASLTIATQPIVRLATGEVVGVEALARFPTLGYGPAGVFAEAWHAEVGVEVELAAVDAAVRLLDVLADGVYLAINVAPTTLMDAAFARRVGALAGGRLVVEVTEHAVVEDYDAMATAVGDLVGGGVRLAIDDVGTGFSSLEKILRLEPAILKLAHSLISGVDHSPMRQALISSLATFAQRMGLTTVAEGIETAAEAATLHRLGVDQGQGFHLGRPCPPHELAVISSRQCA